MSDTNKSPEDSPREEDQQTIRASTVRDLSELSNLEPDRPKTGRMPEISAEAVREGALRRMREQYGLTDPADTSDASSNPSDQSESRARSTASSPPSTSGTSPDDSPVGPTNGGTERTPLQATTPAVEAGGTETAPEAEVDPEKNEAPEEDGADGDPDRTPPSDGTLEGGARPYIRISPARAQVTPAHIVNGLYGFYRSGDGRTLPFNLERTLPLISSKSTFEFLIHKPSDTQRFDFYLGVVPSEVDGLKNLAANCRAMYPESFAFEITPFAVADAFKDPENAPDHQQTLANLDGLEALAEIEGFTELDVDAIRTAAANIDEDDLAAWNAEAPETPAMIRWSGVETKNNDWMTLLSPFSEVATTTDDTYRSPLSVLLEQAVSTSEPFVFQAVFTPRHDWTKAAEKHKRNLKMGQTGTWSAFKREFSRQLLGTSEQERRQLHRPDITEQVGGTVTGDDQSTHLSRMGQIDVKQPTVTYNVSLRAAGDSQTIHGIENAFTALSGPYYGLKGRVLDADDSAFQRLCEAKLATIGVRNRFSKSTPIVVASPDELANFVAVPNTGALPKASRGASGGSPNARSPLTATDEEQLAAYDHGMCIGYAKTAKNHHDDIPVHLSAEQLSKHMLRAASTGGGKSTAMINDALTTYETLDGPTFLLDRKGSDLCAEYKRAHFKQFGDLDDVIHLRVPGPNGELPAFPFFDIRPQLAAGMPREVAVQEKVDRYTELVSYIIGREANERAFVAQEILSNLIEALFDPVYGKDAYPITDLRKAAFRMATERTLPEMSDPELEATLARHFQSDQQRFYSSVDAVMNRVTKLRSRDFIWRLMNFVPEWDDEDECYADSKGLFNVDELLDSDSVVLIDTGGFRPQSGKLFTFLFLDYLWSTVKLREKFREDLPSPSENFLINLLIDEAAPALQAELVRDEMLPQARGFSIGFEVVVQFAEQVKRDALDTKAYKEIIANINTKLIGKLGVDDELINSLFHEDLDAEDLSNRLASLPSGEWVCQLPDTGFGSDTPELVTVQPLDIPRGHSESEEPVDGGTVSLSTGETYRETDNAQWKHTRFTHCLVPGWNAPVTAAQRAGSFGVGVSNTAATSEDFAVDEATQDEDAVTAAIEGTESDSEAAPGDGDSESGIPEGEPRPARRAPDPDEPSFHDLVMGEADTTAAEHSDGVDASTDSATDDGQDTADSPSGSAPGLASNEYGTVLGTGGGSDSTGHDADGPPQNGPSPSGSAGTDSTAASDDHPDSDTGADEVRSGDAGTSDGDEGSIDTQQGQSLPDDLTGAEFAFLTDVVKGLNGDLDGYDLTQSMTHIRDSIEGPTDEEKLVANGYLEIESVVRNKYYWVTEKGLTTIDRSIRFGDGVGDFNEKVHHKVVVAFLGRYLEQNQGQSVRTYHEPMGGGMVFDVAAYAPADEGESGLTVIGEVLTRVKAQNVVKHYEDFTEFPHTRKVWVVKNKYVAQDLVEALHDAGHLESIPDKSVQKHSEIANQAFGDTKEWNIVGERKLAKAVKNYTGDDGA